MMGRGVVVADHGYVILGDPEGDLIGPSGAGSNGVIDPMPPGSAAIQTGAYMGGVAYTWSAHLCEPPVEPGWEDIAQVPVLTSSGALYLFGGEMESDEVNLANSGPGTYLVRCSGKGRDLDRGEVVELSRETFHLDIWPAPGCRHGLLIRTSSPEVVAPEWTVGVPRELDAPVERDIEDTTPDDIEVQEPIEDFGAADQNGPRFDRSGHESIQHLTAYIRRADE